MKAAFATTDGVSVNEHFGRAGMFAIYEVTDKACSFKENRKFADGRDKAVEDTRGSGESHDSAVEAKVDKLSDCRIVYMTEIGGPSAARLTRKGIMPVKVKQGSSIEAEAARLHGTLKNSPPPWLRRLLNDEDKK